MPPFNGRIRAFYFILEYLVSYSIYSKPVKTANQIITDLQSKGIIVRNIPNAVNTLENINYFRFKIYLRHFMDESTGVYYPNTKFDEALELYRFDDELRDLIFSIIGRIEIKLRSKLDYIVTGYTNKPFWYLDKSYVNENSMYSWWGKVNSSFIRSKDKFAVHYKENYYNTNDNYKLLPPFWIISELLTFGELRELYNNIDRNAFNIPGTRDNKIDELSQQFGASNFSTLKNWIRSIRDVRNKCAHHSRLWNTNLTEPRDARSFISILPSHRNRLYLFLVLLEKINQSLNLGIQIKDSLLSLEHKYPMFLRERRSAGFPNNWHTDSFWT